MSRKWWPQCFRAPTNAIKPFKLYSPRLNKRIGVTASSLKQITKRAREHFSIFDGVCRLVLEEDGTELEDEDYFSILPPHTVVVVLEQGDKPWRPAQHQLEATLEALQDANKLNAIQEGVTELMQSQARPHIRRLLGEIISSTTLNVYAETKQDDPEWFKDLGRLFYEKEQYMRENARRRIRGYFRTAADFIKREKKMSVVAKRELNYLLDIFNSELKRDDEFSDYFARSSELDERRLCDAEGWFRCEGSYEEEYCPYEQHRVNPYGSWQQRVFFSTWNLDHGIEKSRQVLPSLVQAVKKRRRNEQLNWQYFYDLLFTRINLKLVHIECHDKTEHLSALCDPQYFYITDSDSLSQF